MTTQQLLKRIDELITAGNTILTHKDPQNNLDYGSFRGFRSASLSFLEKVFGPDHVHTKEFSAIVSSHYVPNVEAGIHILQAARDDIEGGWLHQITGLVSAGIFADFLEMAEHLLEEGYKDAAAVMVGSVLEEHIRKLCDKNDVPVTENKNGKPVPLRAELLNQNLCKAEVYNKLDQKQITSWLDLRNKAAHGHYEQYTKEQVKLMLDGVLNFMQRSSL